MCGLGCGEKKKGYCSVRVEDGKVGIVEIPAFFDLGEKAWM